MARHFLGSTSFIDGVTLVDDVGSLAVEGENGDMPAVEVAARSEGLAILVYESRYRALTYDSFDVFRGFLVDKDETWVLGEHATRNLPTNGVREAYRRFSKALVAVGAGRGTDRVTGMEMELVAEANPYTSLATRLLCGFCIMARRRRASG